MALIAACGGGSAESYPPDASAPDGGTEPDNGRGSPDTDAGADGGQPPDAPEWVPHLCTPAECPSEHADLDAG
jgi:hypothetical protein